MMKKPHLSIISTTMALAIIFTTMSAYAKGGPKITWYGKGKSHLKLDLKSANYKGKLNLKGFSKLAVLFLKLQDKSGSSGISLTMDHVGKKVSGGWDFDVEIVPTYYKGKHKIIIFGSSNANGKLDGLVQFEVNNTAPLKESDDLLDLNEKIVDYLKPYAGKKIGRGECWDTAQDALDTLGARWQRTTGYGPKLNYKKDKIKPGDVIQFKSMKIVRKTGNSTITESIGAPDHTSIVWEVISPTKYKVFHQNVNGKRYMLVGDLDLSGDVSGYIQFYRPRAGVVEK